MPEHRVSFFSDTRQLQGTLVLPDSVLRSPAVILCHGFGSYDDDLGAFSRMAEQLVQSSIASLRFSFSGSDPYPDKGTIRPATHWVADCLAALFFLRAHDKIDRQRIGLLGMSVGGGVVIQAAALCKHVRCVVALAPVADGHAWLRHRWLATRSESAWNVFVAEVEADQQSLASGTPSREVPHFDIQAFPDEPSWNQTLARYPRLLRHMTLASAWDTFHFQPLLYANRVTQPLRVIHGGADQSVPLNHGRLFHERAQGDKDLCVLPGAPHCCWDTPFEPQIQRLSVEWLRKWLSA